MIMKVLTYNLRRATNSAGENTLNKIIGFLSKFNSDLIGLQEIDRFAKRTGFDDQVQKIKNSLSYNAVYASSLVLPPEDLNKPKREYCLMCLSRFPITKSETHFLRKSKYSGRWFTENRICLESILSIDAKKVALFVTHIDAHEIEKQIKNLISVLRKMKLPKILVGDFNIPPEDENIKTIQEETGLKNITSGKRLYTHEDNRGKQQLDYIFVPENIEVENVEVLNVDFSDHKPLFATLSL